MYIYTVCILLPIISLYFKYLFFFLLLHHTLWVTNTFCFSDLLRDATDEKKKGWQRSVKNNQKFKIE